MKRVLWLLAAGFLITDLAFADTYVKAAGMNGMGVNETWYSGKKKREVSHVDLGGGITRDEIVITRVDNVQDEITVKVELKPDHQDCWPRLQAQLGKDLASAHEGLRFNIELAKPGELPRFELKAKRLQDLRPHY